MSSNIVQGVKMKTNIVEIIGRFVQLRRGGKSWVGLCPFHKENNASFHVYEDSGYFVCFGCGAKGDIFTFYEKYYNLSFLDACERLAKEHGINWEKSEYKGHKQGRIGSGYGNKKGTCHRR